MSCGVTVLGRPDPYISINIAYLNQLNALYGDCWPSPAQTSLGNPIQTLKAAGEQAAATLVEAVEGLSIMEEGNAHPQGPKVFNGRTHQVFGRQYISKVENGKLALQHQTAIEDGFYPDEVDYTDMAF